MTDKHADIRAALAAGPTPGPWQTYEKCVFFGREGGFHLNNCPRPSENAAHIAACHPEAIRALLAERDALIHDNSEYVSAANELATENQRLREALSAASDALEEISNEMTLGARWTNAGQYLLDALPIVRAALAQQEQS